MYQWGIDLVTNIKNGNTAVYNDYKIPDKAQGIGLWEAPRGALGHWIDVEGKEDQELPVRSSDHLECLPPGR